MAYYFVYRITNVANGKVYIGKTSSIRRLTAGASRIAYRIAVV